MLTPRAVTLHGYQYSVYVRIVRMTLLEKRVTWRHVEVDPFAAEIPAAYLRLNPFGRVPTLVDGDFVLFETTAITRYIDEAFEGPPLQPDEPQLRARMNQLIAIADSYGYWPMVRQVFSHRVFRPAAGEPVDEAVVVAGLAAAQKVLDTIEGLIGDAGYLAGDRLSLADMHLAAMMAYFTAAPEGEDMLSRFARLSSWWTAMKDRPSLIETEPGLPSA